MAVINLDANNLSKDYDWVGNNAAFRCPLCHKVFIVTNAPIDYRRLPGYVAPGVRDCPACGKSRATVTGGAADPQAGASVEWPPE